MSLPPDDLITITHETSEGLSRIWSYDNIAIVVLMLCLCFSGLFNIILLRAVLKSWPDMAKQLIAAMGASKDAMTDNAIALTKLNERIGHHD
ncbi:MAG: hypothetical protein J0H19_18750 [Rhodospirillales bacterium]|nr:hypothetical protein [Rhodospirillales bacterium]MBN8928655.1 hypothetical protein [Rhodospirillales bacterium]